MEPGQNTRVSQKTLFFWGVGPRVIIAVLADVIDPNSFFYLDNNIF